MDSATAELFRSLGAQLDAERLEIESSLIAHRTLLEELLARQFDGQRPVFEALIDECMQAARELAAEPGRTEAVRQELAAQIAAKLAVIRQRVRSSL